MSVTPRGLSIQAAYRDYADGNFLVNRKYQRKLVWSRDEKRKLIDSILRGYPIPLILLATETASDGSKSFEILDGMQRLNAIFEFIENHFDVGGRYFRLEELSRAKQRQEEGVFETPGEPFDTLDREQCSNFVDYTLAITEFPATDEAAVNDVFGRINAYGRRLSNQERRQAGVVSGFATLVRTLSAEMRGDVSRETLDLSEMPSISIDPDETYETYGINADETFWCEQGILRRNQLREAEDEQLVADIVISILRDEPFAFSGANLNEYYDTSTEQSVEIERLINRIGPEALKESMLATLAIILDVFRQADDSPNAMKRVLNPDAGGNPIKGPFYAAFIAFYELCVREEKSPFDHSAIVKALHGLQSKLNVARGQVTADARRQNIDITKGLIDRYFDEREPPSVNTGSGLGIRLANALRRSKVETAAFETKQGILDLGSQRNENPGVIRDILQTICGIANLGPDSDGAVFIGVADNEGDANRIEQLDGVRAICVGARYVVGVEREASVLTLDLDRYLQRISQAISNSRLSEPLKTSVLSKMDFIDFRSLSVITIWVPPQNSMSTLDDELFVRRGSGTERINGVSAINAVQSLFSRGT
ncbi:DUF262 domain-containing protein [Planctomycetota bacterium]